MLKIKISITLIGIDMQKGDVCYTSNAKKIHHPGDCTRLFIFSARNLELSFTVSVAIGVEVQAVGFVHYD